MSMQVIKKDISPDTFTCNLAFGSNAGCDYGFVGWFDCPVTKIILYLGKASIGCLKVEKSDGTCITIGATPSGRTVEWTFQEGELFKRVQVFTNAQTLAGICLETNRQTLEEHIDDKKKSSHMPHEVMNPEQHGPGRCIGVFGNADLHVESLGFAIERKLLSAEQSPSHKGKK